MKLSLLYVAASTVLLVPGLASAQAVAPAVAGPAISAGATIYDPQGGEVGKVKSVANDSVVIDTGTHEATLPISAFGSSAKGPTINATKAQVDALVIASIDKANAALTTALVPGSEVRGKSGAIIGTVKEVTNDQVIIDRPSGAVSLTRRAFALGPRGLTISLTAAELETAAKTVSPAP